MPLTADQDVTIDFAVHKFYEMIVPASQLAEALGITLAKLEVFLDIYAGEKEGDEFDPTAEQISALIELAEHEGDQTVEEFDIETFEIA